MNKNYKYVSFDANFNKEVLNKIKEEVFYGRIEIGSNCTRVFYGNSIFDEEEVSKVCGILKEKNIPYCKIGF